jgi:hypothetical protein
VYRLTAGGDQYGSGSCPGAFAPTGVCATGGVRFGGRTFGPSATGGLGGDETSTGVLAAAEPGTCTRLIACVPQPPYPPRTAITVQVPAGSAMLLSGRTPPRARSNR